MSIMKAQYRAPGGPLDGSTLTPVATQTVAPTVPPGIAAGQNRPPLPELGSDESANITAIIKYLNDNRATYYEGPTVASFNANQINSNQNIVDRAGEYNNITDGQLGYYEQLVDRDSTLNKQLSDAAAVSASAASFGAGTPGSTNALLAQQIAADTSYQANLKAGNAGINAAKDDFFTAAEAVGQVGDKEYNQDQLNIDADKIRSDFYALEPIQQITFIQNLIAQQKGNQLLESGNGGGNSGWDTLWSMLGLKANQGGVVPGHKAMGGPALGGPEAMPSEGIMGQAQQPEQNPMMGAAPPPMPGGIAGMAPPPMDPMMAVEEGMPALALLEILEEPMSELDMLEDEIMNTIAASGGNITVTRKQTKRRSRT